MARFPRETIRSARLLRPSGGEKVSAKRNSCIRREQSLPHARNARRRMHRTHLGTYLPGCQRICHTIKATGGVSCACCVSNLELDGHDRSDLHSKSIRFVELVSPTKSATDYSTHMSIGLDIGAEARTRASRIWNIRSHADKCG